MDPISAIIAAWLVVLFLTTRAPKLLMESRDGAVDEAYEARLKRLEDAGIAGASGGPLRQYVGNAWRDFIVDRDRRRGRGKDRSWWGRQVDRVLDRWRDRHASPDAGGPVDTATSDTDPLDPDEPLWPDDLDGDPEPVGYSEEPYETETVEDTAVWDRPPRTEPASEPDEPVEEPASEPDEPVEEPAGEPVRVESTAGDPIPNPPHASPTQPQLEGADMTQAVARGGEVTGVVSGAQEAAAIQRQVEAIKDAYTAALRQLGQRIVNLGEQAMSNVELRANGPVVASIAQAAESCAAAIAHANGSAAEVSGALQVVKAGFNRLNS